MRRFVSDSLGMTIRRGTPFDATLLAEHRAAVWHEVGEWSVADLSPQVPIWAQFFRKHLEDDTYIAFIAEEDGKTIGSGSMLVHLAIPRPNLASDRAGRVQSLWVDPVARRRGVARSIIETLVGYSRDAMLISLSLQPSDEARMLYQQVGFEVADEMLLRLR